MIIRDLTIAIKIFLYIEMSVLLKLKKFFCHVFFTVVLLLFFILLKGFEQTYAINSNIKNIAILKKNKNTVKKPLLKKGSNNSLKTSILVDIKAGKIIDAHNPHKKIYPASLTKLMTIYILFTELSQNRLSLNSSLKISAKASKVEASKLYLKPGQKIIVKEAILALIIKSANDVAIAVAEQISGTEQNFAKLMNQYAKKLQMYNTNFVNASGLHHKNQMSTSADIAKLVIALHKNFPKYSKYLQEDSFKFRGKNIFSKKNRIILQHPEVNWIKSGYTKTAGQNLMINASIGNRNLIFVTTGNLSLEERNKKISKLLNQYKYSIMP